MFFRLSAAQENELVNQPETGMGYQLVQANRKGSYTREKFLVLNAEIIIEINSDTDRYVRKIITGGLALVKRNANYLILNAISVLTEDQLPGVVNESQDINARSAIDNPVINANGDDIFIRLSAFADDKRMDKINRCLRPGSFATTLEDYLKCKTTHDDPIERYALPSNDKIRFIFYIQPVITDTLQKGMVQPANDKRGGGKETYFASGTSAGTLLNQTPY